MSLLEYVRRYCGLRDMAASTEAIYLKHARGFVREFGDIPIHSMTIDLLAQHLRSLRAQGKSDSYRRSRRNHLLSVVRAASKDMSLTERPNRIFREDVPIVRIRDYIPRGFRLLDVGALLHGASQLTGCYRNGVQRSAFWRAWIRLAWESGLSSCDLLRLHRRSIADDGSCQTVRIKTGNRHAFRLRPRTLEALDEIGPPDRELCFPLWGSTEMLRREFRRVRKLAGLKQGTLKWLRSGSGSEVELQQPGSGHIHLANSVAVFEAHYKVADIVLPRIPMPRDPEGPDRAA